MKHTITIILLLFAFLLGGFTAHSQEEEGIFAKADEATMVIIRDLENIKGVQGFRGRNFRNDPIYKKLIKCGDAAVVPLIDCVENDNRVTNCPIYRGKENVSVYLVAFCALQDILKQPSWWSIKLKGNRKKVAEDLRAYWKKYGKMAPEDRWYHILADDSSDMDSWFDMARNLINLKKRYRKGDDSLIPVIEKLKNRKPSVTELLRKRSRDCLKHNSGSPMLYPSVMVFHLVDWNPKVAKKELRWLHEKFQKYIDKPSFISGDDLSTLVRCYKRRMALKDENSFTQYTQWVDSLKQENLRKFTLNNKLLEPMWRNPKHPTMKKLAEKIFNDPSSTFYQLYDPKIHDYNNSYGLNHLFNSPLICVEGYRKSLLRHLDDQKIVGSVKIEGENRININGENLTNVITPKQKVGTVIPLRSCDFHAWNISKFDGAPFFNPTLPEDKRNKKIEEIKHFLRKYGKHYKVITIEDRGGDLIVLDFPILSRPATKKDVESGKAIFSLYGKKEIRIPRLGFKLPIYCAWTSSERKRIIGRIYQAEEILVDGIWQRYYGFVGENNLRKVPASEVEIFHD